MEGLTKPSSALGMVVALYGLWRELKMLSQSRRSLLILVLFWESRVWGDLP